MEIKINGYFCYPNQAPQISSDSPDIRKVTIEVSNHLRSGVQIQIEGREGFLHINAEALLKALVALQ